MAPIPPVQAGDVITSEFMNTVLAAIEGLEGRVVKLEGTADPNALVITRLDPEAGQHSLQPLAIHGRNFATPANLNEIRIDGQLVDPGDLLPGSGATLLRFPLPDIGVSHPQGKLVSVSVSAGTQADVTQYRVLPAAGGNLRVTRLTTQGQPQNTIRLGHSSTIQGAGFSSVTGNNAVRLRVLLAPGNSIVVPSEDGSFNVTAAGPNQLTVMFPRPPQLPGPNTFPAELLVEVGGTVATPFVVTVVA